MTDIICKHCGKKLGEFEKHGERAMRNRATLWDDYYFCKNNYCVLKYDENEAKTK